MSNNSNPLAEVALIIVSALLIITAGTLLYFGKIDFTGTMLILGIVAGIWGVNSAYKAPSPSQQQALQQMLSQILDTMPAIVAHLHPAPPAPTPSPIVIQTSGNPVTDPGSVKQVPFPIPPSTQAPLTPITTTAAAQPAPLSSMTAPMAALGQRPQP